MRKKENFKVVVANGSDKVYLIKEGTYDDSCKAYCHKEKTGYVYTDKYTGLKLCESSTKSGCASIVNAQKEKIKHMRNSCKYLEAVVNYMENK